MKKNKQVHHVPFITRTMYQDVKNLSWERTQKMSFSSVQQCKICQLNKPKHLSRCIRKGHEFKKELKLTCLNQPIIPCH